MKVRLTELPAPRVTTRHTKWQATGDSTRFMY
jgi:hypothetical protein